MESEKFNKVIEHADNSLQIGNEVSTKELARKMESVPVLLQIYTEQGFKLGIELAELCNKRNKMKGELMVNLKMNPDKSSNPKYQILLKTKDDFECQFQSFDEYNELSKQISIVEAQAKHVEQTLSNIKQFGYTLKNILDVKKLEAGAFF
jgi:hypothetical protein